MNASYYWLCGGLYGREGLYSCLAWLWGLENCLYLLTWPLFNPWMPSVHTHHSGVRDGGGQRQKNKAKSPSHKQRDEFRCPWCFLPSGLVISIKGHLAPLKNQLGCSEREKEPELNWTLQDYSLSTLLHTCPFSKASATLWLYFNLLISFSLLVQEKSLAHSLNPDTSLQEWEGYPPALELGDSGPDGPLSPMKPHFRGGELFAISES